MNYVWVNLIIKEKSDVWILKSLKKNAVAIIINKIYISRLE